MNEDRDEPPPRRTEDEATARALRLWVVLARCFDSLEKVDRRSIARHGLIRSEFGVLEMLLHKGPLALSEIGKRILLTSGSVTHVVDKLVERGWVVREPCPADRRVIHARLTDTGREFIVDAFPDHAAQLRDAMAGLNADEQEIAARLLRKLGLFAADRESAAPE